MCSDNCTISAKRYSIPGSQVLAVTKGNPNRPKVVHKLDWNLPECACATMKQYHM